MAPRSRRTSRRHRRNSGEAGEGVEAVAEQSSTATAYACLVPRELLEDLMDLLVKRVDGLFAGGGQADPGDRLSSREAAADAAYFCVQGATGQPLPPSWLDAHRGLQATRLS